MICKWQKKVSVVPFRVLVLLIISDEMGFFVRLVARVAPVARLLAKCSEHALHPQFKEIVDADGTLFRLSEVVKSIVNESCLANSAG